MIRLLLIKELWDLRGVLAISTLGYLYWLYAFTHMILPEWKGFPRSYPLPFEPDGYVQSLIVYGSVVGAFLGLYQGITDAPDSPRMQFLLAQPITATRLVLTRLAIGMGLWATGCFGTLIAAILLSRYFPIFPAPLETWMLTDCLGWLAVGTTIYLGGFLSAIRPGRWFGTRLFPLFGAIGWWYVVLFPVMLNQYKFEAMALFAEKQFVFLTALLFTNAILLLSIVFSFRLFADSPPAHFTSLWGRVMKAASACGAAFILSIGFLSLVVLGYSLFGRSLPRITQETTAVYTKRDSLGISSTGKPLIVSRGRYHLEPVPLDERSQALLNQIDAGFKPGDKKGKPANLPLVAGFYSFSFLQSTQNEIYDLLQMVNNPDSTLSSKQYYPYLNCKHANEILPMSSSKNETEFWYLFLHKGPVPHAYFVGYSFSSRMPLGFIGKNGLQTRQPSLGESFHLSAFEQSIANPLAEEMTGREHYYPTPRWSHVKDRRDTSKEVYSPVWLATDEGIVECDLADRRVNVISPLKDVKKLTYFSDYEKEKSYPIAITSDQVQVLEPGGTLLAKANFPVDFHKNNAFFLTKLNDLIVVEDDFDFRKFQRPEPEDRLDLFWFQKNGDLKETRKITLKVTTETATHSVEIPVIQPMLLFEIVSGMSGAILDFFVDRREVREVVDNYVRRYLPWMAGATLFAMAFCFWREMRSGEGWLQTLGWLAFIALFGVSGWFGYRLHKRWPLLTRCSSCSRKRPVNQERCPHCQAAFAHPAPTVSPIVAPASVSREPQTA